jgi:hypothetical protein
MSAPPINSLVRGTFSDEDRARIQQALQTKLGAEHMAERAGPGNRFVLLLFSCLYLLLFVLCLCTFCRFLVMVLNL